MSKPFPQVPPVAPLDSPVMQAWLAARDAFAKENSIRHKLHELQEKPDRPPIGIVVQMRDELTNAENLTCALWQHFYDEMAKTESPK